VSIEENAMQDGSSQTEIKKTRISSSKIRAQKSEQHCLTPKACKNIEVYKPVRIRSGNKRLNIISDALSGPIKEAKNSLRRKSETLRPLSLAAYKNSRHP